MYRYAEGRSGRLASARVGEDTWQIGLAPRWREVGNVVINDVKRPAALLLLSPSMLQTDVGDPSTPVGAIRARLGLGYRRSKCQSDDEQMGVGER